MPKVAAVAHALPPCITEQDEVRDAVGGLFGGQTVSSDQVAAVYANSRIERRRFMRPLGWYLEAPGRAEANRIYATEGFELLAEAARCCLEKGKTQPQSIDHVIFVSTTGTSAPSLDARLIERLGLPRTATRLPVWGLGCAGGAAALARAADHCRAYPGKRVLVAALECCSLTFLETDRSKKNLVASAIFADGAAAVLVEGSDIGGEGPCLLAGGSHLFADSERVMGWDVVDEGMQLVLSPRLPAIVKAELAELLDSFLGARGFCRADLTDYITHPGGARVIDAYRKGLDLPSEALELTEAHLRRYGNLSSVSVLMVLEEWLETRWRPGRGLGLLSAFGPGFSAEMSLVKG